MRRRCCGKGNGALAFGIGLIVGSFFPDRFVIVIAAAVIIVLAIAASKC